MKRFLLGALLLIAAPAAAEPVTLYDGRLRVDLPAGFRPATEAEILSRYPRAQRPDHVYIGPAGLDAAIAVRRTVLPPQAARPLAELGASAERQITGASPLVTMHRHGPVAINGRDWYALEFRSPSPDSQVENMLRMTVADGHLVIVSGSVTAPLVAQQQPVLRSALETVTLP